MRRSLLSRAITPVVIALAAGAAPNPSWGGFEIVTQDVTVDAINEQVCFEIVFNREPDFIATDSDGTQIEAFQYEIDGDWTAGQESFGFDRIDAVIRGGEIHQEGLLPIRDTRASDDPQAGGWGRILDQVPLDIEGSQVSFTLPASLIDDSDGVFQYRVFAMENGELTSLIQSAVIPLPNAAWSGLSLFGGLCVIGGIKRLCAGR